MTTDISHTKRIAKNSVMLYLRMFVLMAVTLYTSRIVLNALGEEDFGIYNVVGGVIVLFAFLNGAMTAATQRFLAYEIGKENREGVQTVFNTSIIIHFALSLLILILGETVGLWFFNTKLNIPDARMNAAFWVYQLSIVACIINVISIPYNAAITTHERMSAFAWISLFDGGGRLLAAFLLLVVAGDKLVWYAVFVCVIQITVRALYSWYCKRHFDEIRITFRWNKDSFREMFAFSGWNMIGAFSGVLSLQGLSIVLNVFFGPVANAAKGIADQVQGAVTLFYSNFQQAMNPQITKSYARGDMGYMHKLIFTSSRMSFYAVLVLALPIVFETEYILHLWLGKVPYNTAAFVRLSMVFCAIMSMANPLITGNFATGKIKTLLLTVGVINCMSLPIAWIWLKSGGDQTTVYWSLIVTAIAAFIVRLIVVKKQLSFSLRKYTKECLLPIIPVVLVCFGAVWGIRFVMAEADMWRFVGTTFFSILTVCISVWLFGVTPEERQFIQRAIIGKITTTVAGTRKIKAK